jgi:hypothetical protein
VLATVTGALTLAGAFAEAAGLTEGELTWIVPAVFTAAWAVGALTVAVAISDGWAGLPGSASAGAAHPRATSAAPRAIRRFIIASLSCGSNVFNGYRTSRQRKTGREALAGTFEQEAQGRRPMQVRYAPEPSAPSGGRQQHENEENRERPGGRVRSGRAGGRALLLRHPGVGRSRHSVRSAGLRRASLLHRGSDEDEQRRERAR